MHRLWETVVEPTLQAAQPTVIVEVGTASGAQAEKLLEFAQQVDAVVHLIDPAADIDPVEWQRTYGARLSFHAERSLDALPEIAEPDVVLIDGDHNWYTVTNELRLLEQRARADGREPPLLLAHDIGWPYGRRDLYYEPDAIPEQQRQPHEQLGLAPGEDRPIESGGLNRHLHNAIYEGTPRNGVLTAIEDFRDGSERAYELVLVGGLHGIGVLADRELLARKPALAKQLGALKRAPLLRRQIELVERERLALAVRVEEAKALLDAAAEQRERLERDLAAAEDRASKSDAIGERLQAAERDAREAEARAQRLAGERERDHRRTGELLEELEITRAALARAESESELASERERRSAGRLAALRAELTSGRILAEAPAAETPGKPAGESDLRRSFERRYREVAASMAEAGEDAPIGNVLGLDRLGVLAPGATAGPSGAGVDVVVCVHNAPDDVRRCLRSLLAAGGHPFHLILVDDGSDLPTRRLLEWFAGEHPSVELVSNPEPPHGYTIAANLGLRASAADYVVLLNSDTVVTPGWLDAIVELGQTDDEIGILGPLSNAATHQSVPAVKDGSGWALNPLPDWLTPDGMGYLVGRTSDARAPRVPFVNGFCFAVRRGVIERIGEFDEESFAEGFCEENDYAVRALDGGFSLAVSDRAYVHHAKSRSYGSDRRESISREHYRRFLEKHGEARVEALLERFESVDRELEPLRQRLAALTAGREALERGFAELPGDPLAVAFVLPGMSAGGGGGTHSVYQEARALQALGVEARVLLAAKGMERAAAAYDDAEAVFVGYSGERELAERTRFADVIVATHHRTAQAVAAIRRQRDDFLPAYYVQDYEPFFAPEGSDGSDEALLSYGAIPDQLVFAKTDWLASVLAIRHGIQVAKVEPSVDTGVYHRRGRTDRGPGQALRVAAMIRPRTPRRQPLATLRLLERACEELAGEVEAVSFGCTEDELSALAGGPPRGVEHRGLLRREQVAELLRASDVFVDLSIYQAFGRTGLEAMACGCAAILPAVGGAGEYAEDGVNALLAETGDPEGCFAALRSLAEDRDRVARMQAEAAATASRYSSLRAALSEYVLFDAAHQRLGSERAPAGSGSAR